MVTPNASPPLQPAADMAYLGPDMRRISIGLPPDDRERLLLAYAVAAEGHAGLLRDEGTPFIDHPVAVCTVLWDEFACRDADLLCAALLHDVLEDTPYPLESMQAAFGERTTSLVQAVTKIAVPPAEKAARDAAYLAALLLADADVRLLKLADRIHNLRMVPLSGDWPKAERYLNVSRDVFARMAAQTDARAHTLLLAACDALERSIVHATQDTGADSVR